MLGIGAGGLDVALAVAGYPYRLPCPTSSPGNMVPVRTASILEGRGIHPETHLPKANLVNFGILPLTFKDPTDYNRLSQGMRLEINNLRERLLRGDREIPISAPVGVITAHA